MKSQEDASKLPWIYQAFGHGARIEEHLASRVRNTKPQVSFGVEIVLISHRWHETYKRRDSKGCLLCNIELLHGAKLRDDVPAVVWGEEVLIDMGDFTRASRWWGQYYC